ncbi:MAG: endonuclease/exonuclease/phosphatase family protein [Anaerolineae bacterium]|nr:endonuclease/exonuclease/phosphatase family protein [Anaerolineae bacterium]
MADKRFRIGTFNLHNLALPESRFYNGIVHSQEQYKLKVQWTAEQLRRMNGNLVGFQEIFHREALEDVLRESGLYDGATAIVGETDGTKPVVGLVSAFPVIEHCFIPTFPPAAFLEINEMAVPCGCFTRPVLYTKVELPTGLQLIVIVAHLKSKNPIVHQDTDEHDPVARAIGKAKSLIVRTAEATALRCLLLEWLEGNDNPVIVLGDTNDISTAVTSEIVTGSPPWRNLRHAQKAHIWDVLLYDVKHIQARQSYRDAYYTHIHNGHYESLDHILISQEFVRQNRRRLGEVEYVSVLNDHLIDETLADEKVPRWQSDHGQVVVTIRLR